MFVDVITSSKNYVKKNKVSYGDFYGYSYYYLNSHKLRIDQFKNYISQQTGATKLASNIQ